MRRAAFAACLAVAACFSAAAFPQPLIVTADTFARSLSPRVGEVDYPHPLIVFLPAGTPVFPLTDPVPETAAGQPGVPAQLVAAETANGVGILVGQAELAPPPAGINPPLYDVTVEAIPALNTECTNDPPYRQSSVYIADPAERSLVEDAALAFNYGELQGDTLRLRGAVVLGEEGGTWRHFAFTVGNRDGAGPAPVTYFVRVQFQCAPDDDALDYIKEMRIGVAQAGVRWLKFPIAEQPLRTPVDLLAYTKSPYLFSINSAQHHSDVVTRLVAEIDRLTNDPEDRVRYFVEFLLSELNRSCMDEYRTQGHLCLSYAYAAP